MSVRIIIDSSADVTDEIRSRLINLPVHIRFGQEEFLDGETISRREFYEKLVESDKLPSTSQITPSDFDAVFAKVIAAGDTAVVITLASKLSGTYQSACIAAESYEEKVFVVDSCTASISAGVLAEYALQLCDEGLDAATVAARLEAEKSKVCIVAMLDTLEYLKRGGRISKAAAFAGGILSIKPVITVLDGEVVVLGKARGSRQGNNMLISEIEKAGGVDFTRPMLLGYSGLSDALLDKYVEDSRNLWENCGQELRRTLIGSTIGTHVGPGAVAVAFFRK